MRESIGESLAEDRRRTNRQSAKYTTDRRTDGRMSEQERLTSRRGEAHCPRSPLNVAAAWAGVLKTAACCSQRQTTVVRPQCADRIARDRRPTVPRNLSHQLSTGFNSPPHRMSGRIRNTCHLCSLCTSFQIFIAP